jgi:hypothetical protein
MSQREVPVEEQARANHERRVTSTEIARIENDRMIDVPLQRQIGPETVVTTPARTDRDR